MSSRVALCASLALCLLQPGCLFHSPRKRPSSAYVPLPIPVGTVTLVNEEDKFVLVDNGSSPVPPIGGVLKCYTGGAEAATAELVATDVRRRPFTIADIRHGAPRKGDRVVYLPPELQRPAALKQPVASLPEAHP